MIRASLATVQKMRVPVSSTKLAMESAPFLSPMLWLLIFSPGFIGAPPSSPTLAPAPVLDHELVIRSSLAIVSANNALISDLTFVVPFNGIEEYRKFIQADLAEVDNQRERELARPFISVRPCNDGYEQVLGSASGNINVTSGKVLVVNTCTDSSGKMNSDLKYYTGKSVILLFVLGQNVSTFIGQHDSTLRALGLNHFFVGELKSQSQPQWNELNTSNILNASLVEGSQLDIYEVVRMTSQSKILAHRRFRTIKNQATNLAQPGHTGLPFANMDMQSEPPLFSEVSRSNFHFEDFRVGAVMDETYAYDTNITAIQLQGPNDTRPRTEYEFHNSFAVEILRVLQLKMNFTIVPVITDAWGHLDSDGVSWRGMIWHILHDRIDLGISSTADRPFRRDVVDFNMATSQIRLCAFFKTPKSTGGGGPSVAQPFSRVFWCVLAVWLFIAGVTLAGFRYIITHPFGQVDDGTNAQNQGCGPGFDGNLWTPADGFQWAMSAMCMQSYHNLPALAPYRILIGVGYMLSIIVYTAYSGTLISFLSVVVEPIKNLEQLLEARFVMNIVDNPLPLNFLSESQNEYAKAIYDKRKPEPRLSSMSQAAILLNAGRFAFLVDHMNGYESLDSAFTIQEACEIRELEIPYARQQQSSMVAKNSPVKRLIDYQILRMLEFGLVAHWRKKYLRSKPNCDGTTTAAKNFEGVNIERLGLVYRILGGGFVLSILLLLVEMWSRRRSRRRQSNAVTTCT